MAFETDAAAHSGGSVVLTGMATVVTGLTERERLTRREFLGALTSRRLRPRRARVGVGA